ncbi:MAG: amino acid ABC transporter ATP-binding protein, partial [Lachnospiraceae bacterium]|nr:amino acid ABC transporter ATP-binding protein [Lachnospiraceae bacterium]
MINVKGLYKSFGDTKVLNGIDYHIEQGEKIAIIGPSGSGKSTFLRCLNLLETPTKGQIFIDDEEITDPNVNIDKVREKIGMVFQHF